MSSTKSQKPSSAAPRILLGVTGSIAAYKACELVRLWVESGAEVRVAMTPNATRFVAPLTFEVLSGSPVATSATSHPDSTAPGRIGHTDLAAWADLLVVAPATAAALGRLANGIASDAVTLAALAFPAERPRLLAPAMNVEMWRNPAVERAVRTLAEAASPGWRVVGPDAGDLACGAVGPGRMASPEAIFAAARSLLAPRDLAGRRVLILSGPTREYLDAARFVSNPSSGRMGRALAEAARARGAEVVVVTGPAPVPPPPGVRSVFVQTAEEMLAAARREAPVADVVIGAAAVCDFRFTGARAGEKIPRRDLPAALPIEPTPDVLGSLAAEKRSGQVFVGFAAEAGDDEAARKKAEAERRGRGLDLLLRNEIPQAFGANFAQAEILSEDGVEALGFVAKEEIAARLVECAAAQLAGRTARPAPAS